MKSLLPFALAMPSLLCGCASAPRPARMHDLKGTWQLAAAVPDGARIPTLTIEIDGSMHGNGGVNRYRTTLNLGALADGRWQTTPVAGTRMAGTAAAMALEDAFFESLAQADQARIHGEQLQLLRQDVVLAVLVRAQAP